MIGVPPTAGFISKWYILAGAFQADNYLALATIIASTALNAAYFLPIVYAAFFRDEETGHADHPAHGDAPLPMRLALLDFWNASFLERSMRVMLAYSHRLRMLPTYLQQLEMESNGKSVTVHGEPSGPTAPITWAMVPLGL